jgi:hypothetical protein
MSARVSGTILGRIISSFILLLSNIRRLFIGIDSSSGFKLYLLRKRIYQKKIHPAYFRHRGEEKKELIKTHRD